MAHLDRQVDLAHIEARNRAIREIRNRVVSALAEVEAQNYGIAKSDLEHIIMVTDDEYGTSILVTDKINEVAARRGLT